MIIIKHSQIKFIFLALAIILLTFTIIYVSYKIINSTGKQQSFHVIILNKKLQKFVVK